MSTTKYTEELLINNDILQMINDFKSKQYTVESIYSELNVLKNTNQIVRIAGGSDNTCTECKKKAIYLMPSDNTYLCWYHGYNVVKRNKM